VSEPTDSAPTKSPSPRRVWIVRVALGLILLLGLVVRVHGIADESVWWDEFSSMIHLDPPQTWKESPHYDLWNQTVRRETAPSLLGFLKQNRSMDPATMPLYYVLEYVWHEHVDPSTTGLRMLSILIGLCLVPVVYVTGRYLYGVHAGLIAAFLVAASPIHAHFAAEIRMYGLMTLCSALSMYTFIRLVEGGTKRWWALHGLASLSLFWTHPFALFVPFVEGLFFLLFRPRDFRRLVAWIGLLTVIMIPTLVYVATIRFWSVESTESWMRLPTPTEFIADVVADDCVGLTYQLQATPQAWERVFPPERAAAMVAGRKLIGKWIALGFAVAALGLCLVSIRDALRKREGQRPDGRWPWTFFLVLWWVVPPVILYGVSRVWRPCVMPRYTLQCSLALYLLLAAGVMRIPGRPFKVVAVAVLAAVYGYQQMLVFDGPQHTDWKSAAAFIRAEARPDDLLLVHDELCKRIFTFNMGPAPNVIGYATSFDVLADQCAFYVGLNKPSTSEEGGPCTAWAIIRTEYFEAGPNRSFEQALRDRAMTFQFREFGGIQHVLVYEVMRDPDGIVLAKPGDLAENGPWEFCELALAFWRWQRFEDAIAACERALDIDPEYSRAYSYIGMSWREMHNDEAALPAFEKAVALDPHDYPWSLVNLAMLLTDRGRYDEAIPFLEQSLVEIPGNAWSHTCLGVAYMEKGEFDTAIEHFRKAIEWDPGDIRGQEGLQEALARKETASSGKR